LLASSAPEYALVIFGLLALLAVLFVPEGFVVALFNLIDRHLLNRGGGNRPGMTAPVEEVTANG
jgi:hypothetical protein